jgi:hypothetical protein
VAEVFNLRWTNIGPAVANRRHVAEVSHLRSLKKNRRLQTVATEAAVKTLKTFATAEEAYLAASMLDSAGVESSVLDDRAFGGNMLGMTSKHGVRLQVAEEDFDRAREIVGEARDVAS